MTLVMRVARGLGGSQPQRRWLSVAAAVKDQPPTRRRRELPPPLKLVRTGQIEPTTVCFEMSHS
jgi:hypothetical protein